MKAFENHSFVLVCAALAALSGCGKNKGEVGGVAGEQQSVPCTISDAAVSVMSASGRASYCHAKLLDPRGDISVNAIAAGTTCQAGNTNCVETFIVSSAKNTPSGPTVMAEKVSVIRVEGQSITLIRRYDAGEVLVKLRSIAAEARANGEFSRSVALDTPTGRKSFGLQVLTLNQDPAASRAIQGFGPGWETEPTFCNGALYIDQPPSPPAIVSICEFEKLRTSATGFSTRAIGAFEEFSGDDQSRMQVHAILDSSAMQSLFGI